MSTIIVFLLIYHSLFSAIRLFPCRYCVHSITKAHICKFWSIKNKLQEMCTSWYKKTKIAKIRFKKIDWAGDHLSPLKWHNQLQYHLWVDTKIIFWYQKGFFDMTKLLWDDIRICNINDGWMLTSSLDIQMFFLIFLNLN